MDAWNDLVAGAQTMLAGPTTPQGLLIVAIAVAVVTLTLVSLRALFVRQSRRQSAP